MDINNIYETLRENNSSIYKIDVLMQNKDNELLKEVLEYTYTPFKQYYLKQIPDYRPSSNAFNIYTLSDGLRVLDRMARREISGNNAKDIVLNLLEGLSPSDAKVIVHILERSINCGLSLKTINKVWKDLIPEIPYMRCEKLSEKTKKNIKYPAIVQLKADGTFLNIIKSDMVVTCMTRNGTSFHINKVTEYFERVLQYKDNFVITGEAVVYKDGKVLPRKIGNGLINSYIKREETRESALEKMKQLVNKGKGASGTFKKLQVDLAEKEDEWNFVEDNIFIEGWDYIDYNDWVAGKSNVKYSDRFKTFNEIAEDCEFLTSIPTKTINNFDEANDFAVEMMNIGLEGGVLKNLDGIWENKTSKNQIKLKAELDADLLVVGYEVGKDNFNGGIGALICETSDGKLIVSVGSGFDLSGRNLRRVDLEDASKGLEVISDIRKFYEETYHNKIIALKYNEVIKSKSKNTYSLFLPVFDEVRFDKDVADTLERLLDK